MKPEEKDEPEVEEKEEIETPEEIVEEEVKEPAITPEASLAPQPQAAATPAPAAAPAPAQTPPAPAQPSNDHPIMLDEIKAGTSPEVEPEPAVQTPADKAQQMTNENLNFADDLSFGRIKPKTYGDLYHSKDTLGKIGTIFGLMLGGMGSGLTGQPNALMHMMDKEIERDLEAQKKDQENAQNWYNIALQKAMNEPEILAKFAQAEGIENDNQKKQYLNTRLGLVKDEASTNIRNMKRLYALQSISDTINKMPDGPQKASGLKLFNETLAPTVMMAIKNDNEKFAQKKAFIETANPAPKTKSNPPPQKGFAEPGKYYDVVNQKKLNEKIELGKLMPEAPGAIPPQMVTSVTSEIGKLDQHRKNYANANAVFNALAELKNAGEAPATGVIPALGGIAGGVLGTVTTGGLGTAVAGGLGVLGSKKVGESVKDYFERERKIQIDSLIGQLDRDKSFDERKAIAESMLPKWNDTADTLEKAHTELYRQYSSAAAESTPNLDAYASDLKYQLPKYKFKLPKRFQEEEKEKKSDQPKPIQRRDREK